MSNLAIQLSNHSFENKQIRTTIKNGEMWFIAKDICDAVNISNVTDALIKLDEDEKATIGLTDRRGGMGAQRISIVSESGMYTLILRCRDAVKKDTAPYKFRKWVTSEVLPTIRKTGSYSLTINSEQQQAIQQAVNERSYRTGERHQAIYSKLHQQFKIPRYQDLPANQFENAIKWLGGVHSKSGLSDEDWYILARLYCITHRMHQFISLICPALDSIASKYAENFHSMAFHYERELNNARLIIKRETTHIQPKNIIDSWHRVLPVIRNN